MTDCRVYIGNLDPTVSQDEVDQECRRFGKLSSVWVARNPPGFAFVEFEDARDAADAVQGLNEVRLGAQRVRAEIAKNRGKNSAPPGAGKGGGPPQGSGGGGSGPVKHRAVLKNLPASFSWKELEDEMRRIGDVIYADVDVRGDGIVEFGTADDLEYAVRRLDGSKLDGHTIIVFKERDGPPPPPAPGRRYDDGRHDEDYRRDGGGRGNDYGGRRDDYRDDYRRDDRGRDDYRREREDYRRDDRDDDRRDRRGRDDDFGNRRGGDDRGYNGRDDRRVRDDRD